MLKRIEVAKTLPEVRASVKDIETSMYSSCPIKVKGSVVLDGCGRYFAIKQAKGEDYLIEVDWMAE